MDSKQVVCHTIERRRAPRIPIFYTNRDFERSDIITLDWTAATDFVPAEAGDTEWGYVWEVLDETMGQPKTHPLGDWAKTVAYVPPNAYAPGRFDALETGLSQWRDKFIKFGLGITGFNQATFLRGFETFLSDLYVAPDRAERVLDRVFDFENGLIEQALQYPVDAVTFADDWGTQRGLMIPLELWRDVFRPRYAEQFARVRQAGKKVWFHSCGDVSAIMGDLIEIGVDVLELLQPDIFGVERLAKEFGGQVCFCCSVDHQRRAISGTREEIFAYAKILRDTLGAFDGGLILYLEDYACLGMSPQNYQWISEAFQGLNDPSFGEEGPC
jgi:uroporphyrinogen decarboxylase